MRFKQIFVIFRILFILLAIGLFYLQVIRGIYYYDLSRKNIIRVISLEAPRGKILDSNGVVLADTIPSFDISVIPSEIKDKKRLFTQVADYLGVSYERINKNYKKNYLTPYLPVTLYERADKDKVIILEENKLGLPGIIIDIQPKRYYPFGAITAHLLGYLSEIDSSRVQILKPYGYKTMDLIGYGGLEEAYDLVLKGESGGEQIEVDNKGQMVRTVGYKPALSGKDIQVTIDIRAQKIVDKYMRDKKGAVVIIDSYSGDILSFSSFPNYDPNDFVEKRSNVTSELLKNEELPLFDRALYGRYPPGSVFKLVTATAALDGKPALSGASFFCDGQLSIGKGTFRCMEKHGNQDLEQAIVHSCNIYFYNLGLKLGPDLIAQYAYKLGLGSKTQIDLKYEAKGFIPSVGWKSLIRLEDWYKGDTANMSIGQGDVLVTPLQMVRLISVFANGGELVYPHLIKAISEKQKRFAANKPVKLNKKILNRLNETLLGVVDDPQGTAAVTKIKGLRIGGKTGTAQVSGKRAHGWFVGYVGKDKPRYSFCVFLENIGSSYYACVMARDILEEMLKEGLI